MNKNDILKTVDHTLLTQTATWEEIRQILDDAMYYHTASACIPAAYVRQAAEYVNGRLPICTVIGFPNGYHTTAVKVFEASDAVANGASEIDMVIHIGWLKDQKYARIDTSAGAEYIKTSTGFSTSGAVFSDVALMKAHVGPGVKIKAAGGISSFDDAEEFLRLGADRLGTSRLVKLAKNADSGFGY